MLLREIGFDPGFSGYLIANQLVIANKALPLAELGIVKERIEARSNPEIAEAKAETVKALAHAQAGWRVAIAQISDRGGLGRPHFGMVRAATAVDVA